MMNVVSKKYSKALYLVTKPKENTRKVLSELEIIFKATHHDSSLKSFFDDPLTETHVKMESLNKAFEKESFASETKDFVGVLIKNHRFSFLGDIVSELHGLIDGEQGIQRGVVRSAHPLDAGTIKDIETQFEQIMKSKVQLRYENSPELVGGVVAEVAGFTFDDSLENHLNKLSENLIRH